MPTHHIKLDIEFLALVAAAGFLSYYLTDAVVSNVLFTMLISALFFLIGLHLDIDKLRKNLHHRRELGLGLVMVYVFTPLLAFGVSQIVTGGLSEAFIAIGVSAAAIGSPVVWSNIAKGEGSVALVVSGVSLFAGLIIIPVLLFGFNAGIDVMALASKNIIFLGLPLVAGVASKRFDNFLFNDFRHHFSKVALWLLLLVMAVQFQLLYRAEGLAFLSELGTASLLMAAFVAVSFLAAYLSAVRLGIMERKARALGFTSGSKAIGISIFIAAQFSAEAVAFTSAYFFIRQGVCGVIAEYFRHGELRGLTSIRDKLPGDLL